MPRVFLYPYSMASQGSKALAQALNVRRIYKDRNYQHRPSDTIINYGHGSLPDSVNPNGPFRIINNPSAINRASNKLRAFQALDAAGVPIPPFTTDLTEARQWVDEGARAVCRTVLNGHSGSGIVLASTVNELVNAPLYTKYVKKKDEYRIHTSRLGTFDAVQKRVRAGSEGNDFQIRNHANGWVYTRDNVNPPQAVLDAAVQAIQALGLDFGAVDIGYNTHTEQATVYEVNTAPGLEGTTIDRYAQAISSLINNF